MFAYNLRLNWINMFPIKTTEVSSALRLPAVQESGLVGLPLHVVQKTISFLPVSSFASLASTCRAFALLPKEDSIWELLFCDRFLPGLPKETVIWEGAFLQAYKKQHRIDSNLKNGVCASYVPLHCEIGPCSLAVSGRRAVAGFAHEIIKIWDLATGACINTFTGHRDFVTCVALKGDLLYSGSLDYTIKIWDLKGERCQKTLKFDGEAIFFLSVDDKALFAGFYKGRLRGWDVHTFELFLDLTLEGGEVTAFAMDKDRVFWGFADRTIGMMDLEGGEPIKTFCAREGKISSLALGMDRVFVGFQDGKVEILNRGTGRSEIVLDGHVTQITGLAFAEGRLYSCSFDRKIMVWDFGAPDKVILQQLLKEIQSWHPRTMAEAERRFVRMSQKGRDEDFLGVYTTPVSFEGDIGGEEYYRQNWGTIHAIEILLATLPE